MRPLMRDKTGPYNLAVCFVLMNILNFFVLKINDLHL
ncbi:hypothetical protein SLEP1_g34799 [Rubroshorea leprosula]|uniref:Uncharacterized protein n=1 Tax=Rubroshorea leprosula TaxID=152421 RepID=A0AAV5KL52_9ROSI|nr:hypothetical protein SLEP1_g34799 [Rubroshorea leprosula]